MAYPEWHRVLPYLRLLHNIIMLLRMRRNRRIVLSVWNLMASFNSATPKTFKNTKFGLWIFAFLDFGRYSISTIFSDTFCEHPPFHSISHYTVKHAFIVTTLSMIVRSHCGALEVTRLDTERYWTITLTINLIPIVGAEKIDFKVWRSINDFDLRNFTTCSTKTGELLPAGTNLVPITEEEKIDFKVSRSTGDLDLANLTSCSTRCGELLPVGINLLPIVGAEKIDFKVWRSIGDLELWLWNIWHNAMFKSHLVEHIVRWYLCSITTCSL